MWSSGSLVSLEQPRAGCGTPAGLHSLPLLPRPPQWVPETPEVLCLCRAEGAWLSTPSPNQLLAGHGGLAGSCLLVGGGGGPACTQACWAEGASGAGWINCLFCSQVSVLDPSPGAAMKSESGLGEQNVSSGLGGRGAGVLRDAACLATGTGRGLPRDQEHRPGELACVCSPQDPRRHPWPCQPPALGRGPLVR